MRGLFEPLLNEITVRQENALAVPAHLARRHRTRRTVALHQLYHAGNRDIKAGCRLTAACATENRRDHALTQIVRKGLCHRCWPPPSQHLESLFAEKRNPLRFG